MGRIKNKQIESIGADKVTNVKDKNFVTDTILSLINQFNIDANGILQYSGGAIGMPQYKEITYSASLGPMEVQAIMLPATFNKYDIRTVYFSSTANIQLSVYDNTTKGFLVYNSLVGKTEYDVVNVPCEDKSGNKNINLVIANQDNTSSVVQISIKITSLA